MKQKNNFKLRHIGAEHIIVAEGLNNIDFSKIISLNDTAAWLWEQLEALDADFTETTLADLLVLHYDVEYSAAVVDVKHLLFEWEKVGLIEH